MSTAISSKTPTPNSLFSNSSSSSSSSSSATTNAGFNLKPSDFLNLMITQLQHQDPTNPTSSSELLSQMSQIGQLQSSTDLQSSLKSFGLQTSISSASGMIGKNVQGLDSNSAPISGVVTSVQVAGGNVSLSLDSGQSLPLSSVTGIMPAASGTKAS